MQSSSRAMSARVSNPGVWASRVFASILGYWLPTRPGQPAEESCRWENVRDAHRLRSGGAEVISEHISLRRAHDEAVVAVRAPHVPRHTPHCHVLFWRCRNSGLYLQYESG